MKWWEHRGLPADSLPMTNVTGTDCCIAFSRARLAAERKDRGDTRGKGMINGSII